ncbi:uncharacterized protein [Miscanthus floridulus]|uniref:uncharacterized protein n=1 Tax=Miscanthus floridulus TaxID=154761 RepID=UPI0034584DCF
MAAEIRWLAENKMVTCPSLKPIQRNRNEEVKFTFDVSKCDRIFDELLKIGHIRINYTLPSADELRRRAYCKYHNSYSHATNDCNVFRRQVQSALNEGRLSLTDMQVNKVPFSAHMNVVEAGAPAILIQPKQADKTQGKNVIIGEPRVVPNVQKNSGRTMVLEKDEGGKNKLTITAGSAETLRRQRWRETYVAQQRPARPTPPVGQANPNIAQVQPAMQVGQTGSAPAPAKSAEPTTPVGQAGSSGSSSSTALGIHVTRTFIPQNPEVGVWKTNEQKKNVVKPLCTFDRLMAKYKEKKDDS